ncbi:hypothetical protein CAXC1_160002 [Candidatus Xenohaliotis californiensis]|uniref:Type II secretion system protein n=1 Tax=Candidatus Xenohaliotis californiensis TaxID=84677 RepID=A0ABM9N7A9_9RICK|nr:hypothetical protein CAXC1_160002 [Candidatus Xenohaliotis californiensis]
MITQYRKLSGVSLVETLITISIMTLLIVTVMQGRSLFTAAEIQRIIDEINIFDSAVFNLSSIQLSTR